MDVDMTDESDSEYRILFPGDQVKYILVEPGTYDSDDLLSPLDFLGELPELPPTDWTRARLSRKSGDCNVSVELLYEHLPAVSTCWHPDLIDILSLSPNVVAKFARFDFEMDSMDHETAIYKTIQGRDIGPAFLGHLTEHGRVMGCLMEKVEGHSANIDDLEGCREVVKRLHALGVVHGDLNRYNFVVSEIGATLIDFEEATTEGDTEAMEEEYAQLTERLTDESGLGFKTRLSEE
ncbi:alpha-galactosidase A [Amylocystis lapponica]|nr:alpha-galactosidase A [Amylocystis lapponica]